MRIAFVGLGKLGLPVACAYASRGNSVIGYDIDAEKRSRYRASLAGLYEPGIGPMLYEQQNAGRLRIVDDLETAVNNADIIFVAVPTPSLPHDAFDTSYVEQALSEIASVMDSARYRVIALISTVLPGTCRAKFLPLLNQAFRGLPSPTTYGFAYNAQFIAMGTVVEDVLDPEFVLIGEYDKPSGEVLSTFYRDTLRPQAMGASEPPILRMTLEEAEVVKCAYNNFISFKIVYANALMEMCAKLPFADVDVVSGALGYAKQRLLSPLYLRGGLADGGGCHPRDNRAMSYLAQRLNLSTDPFAFVSKARTDQTIWMAGVVANHARRRGIPIKVLGLTFKPNTNLIDDSPAGLLIDMLGSVYGMSIVETYDPLIAKADIGTESGPRVYVLGTAWPELANYPFVKGSVVVDPHGLLSAPPEGCLLDSVGRDRF